MSKKMISVAYGAIVDLPIGLAEQLIDEGLVEPYNLIEPTGTIEIDENGEFDVSQYANANVNVSGGGGSPLGSVTIVNNTSNTITVSGVRKLENGIIDSGSTPIDAGQSGEVFMIPAFGSVTDESVGYVCDILEINMNQNVSVDQISFTGSGADIKVIGKIAPNKVAIRVYAPNKTILTLSVNSLS